MGRQVLAWARMFRATIYYRTSLGTKILIPVFVITLLVIGILSWFSFVSLRSTIATIYEQRARCTATVVSKSIQEKEYVLYYSEELDADIENILKSYESMVGVTIIGMGGRGLVTIASTDPTKVGELVPDDEQGRLLHLREVEVSRVRLGGTDYLRAHHPLIMDSELVGIVSLDMSLAEQRHHLRKLALQIGIGAVIGFVILGTLLYTVLRLTILNPTARLARAVKAVSRRNFEIQVSPGPPRRPGMKIRDQMVRLIEVFNLMIKVIASREGQLREMVVLDELTGVYNFPHFQNSLSVELAKSHRYKHPLSLLVLEVMEIDEVQESDREGILVTVANFLTGHLRNVDPIFRIAEYRFVALLPETPHLGAQAAAQRLMTQSADITSTSEIPFSLRIEASGWGEGEIPEVEDIISLVQAPLKGN
jgi:GGDEF domain-containing protein